METSSPVVVDAFSITNAYGLSVSAKAVARYSLSLSLSALDSVAPPAVVRTDIFRHASAPAALARRSMRRIRRRTHTEGGGEDDGFFGDGHDGPFGGGGDGGRGWNSGDSDPGWDGSGDSSSSDPAFDFIYEVVCWIAFSSCAHFAFKRMGRLLAPRGPSILLMLGGTWLYCSLEFGDIAWQTLVHCEKSECMGIPADFLGTVILCSILL
ncbi:hypothetical protein ZIOFF_005650 [Zingiber officinale]|uniref:Uncharacterized protein n=1 Tax=Zingiber officinale TaxID=94328 RepID=A0A8J5LRT2_ZINOF|nr:hypothetical protein ZIOFF_005650 [Zingiber officinale]